MKETLRTILFILSHIIFISLFVFLIIVLVIQFEKVSCERTANAMSVNYKYSFYTDCLIEINNKWIPLNNYREFNEELK
jgi:hypothetical protein